MSALVISHPEKVLFPGDGISKGELASYYEAVAPLLVPFVRGRPVTMERYPRGIGAAGFIQKDVSKGFPEWLERASVPKKDGVVRYPLIGDVRSLLWVANQNCITPHVWSSRLPELERPDLCVFDLDPSHDDPEALRTAALQVRDLLAELGLPSSVKTSGSKGFHIVVALDADSDFQTAWHFSHGVGAVLVKRSPDRLTQEFIKADRGGRILVDTGRNGPGATFAAPYAVRARPGAPVSAPCTWQEVEERRAGPQTFTLRSMADRIAAIGDPWAELAAEPRSLKEPLERLTRLLTREEWRAALAAASRKPAGKQKKAPS